MVSSRDFVAPVNVVYLMKTLSRFSLFILMLCFSGTAVAQTGIDIIPIVMKGSAFKSTNLVQGYSNAYKATDVVGFVYAPGQPGNWIQIPIQVDERDTIDAGKIYNTSTYLDPWSKGIYGNNANYSRFKTIQYCDTSTFTGPDHDPTFDADDELALMGRDLGLIQAPPTAHAPAGVDTTTGVEVKMPRLDGQTGYVYLFNRANSSLSPSAGKAYINSYTFSFTQEGKNYGFPDYKAKYNLTTGPNREKSYVTTPYYKRGFADRWIDSILVIRNGTSGEMNLYDRHTVSSVPADCTRSEYTFSGEDVSGMPSATCNPNPSPHAEGAFVTNKSGPIRVIRSVMGANSGPLTQRTHILYDQMEIITTYCRVHNILSFTDDYDYNKAAGVMYYNNNNNNPATQPGFASQTGMKGLVIDGNLDPQWKPGPLIWELVNSNYGAIFRYNTIVTDLPAYKISASGPTIYEGSYYYDDANAQTHGVCMCTGDNVAWGISGHVVTSSAAGVLGTVDLPYTDPRYSGKSYTIAGRQINFYLPSSLPQADSSRCISAAKYLNGQEIPVVSNWPHPFQDYTPVPAINIYPNPTSGMVNISATGEKGQRITAVFYNLSGEQICSYTATGYLMQTVDLHAQSNGIYIVRIFVGSKVIAKKILVGK